MTKPKDQAPAATLPADPLPVTEDMFPVPSGPPKTAAIVVQARGGVQLATLDDLWRFTGMLERGGMLPKDMNRSGAFIAIEMGMELGLTPFRALQSVANINGRPSVFGDAALGLVRQSGLLDLESFREFFAMVDTAGNLLEGESLDFKSDNFAAVCEGRRCDDPSAVVPRQTFSIGDAKKAGLWNKAGPWTNYPKRQLKMRARSWLLRDQFTDVLCGFFIAEEARDIPGNAVVAPIGGGHAYAAGPSAVAEPEGAPEPKPTGPPPASPAGSHRMQRRKSLTTPPVEKPSETAAPTDHLERGEGHGRPPTEKPPEAPPEAKAPETDSTPQAEGELASEKSSAAPETPPAAEGAEASPEEIDALEGEEAASETPPTDEDEIDLDDEENGGELTAAQMIDDLIKRGQALKKHQRKAFAKKAVKAWLDAQATKKFGAPLEKLDLEKLGKLSVALDRSIEKSGLRR